MTMEGDLSWGGEPAIQRTDDVLWNRVPETCVILLPSVTLLSSITRGVKKGALMLWDHLDSF